MAHSVAPTSRWSRRLLQPPRQRPAARVSHRPASVATTNWHCGFGTRDGWETFFSNILPTFMLAWPGQLNKIAAEEARAAATEKARQAGAEKARLAAEQATAAAQARAAADARAAEQARLAAEKMKQEQQAKADAADPAHISPNRPLPTRQHQKRKRLRMQNKANSGRGEQKPAQVAALPPDAARPSQAHPDSNPPAQEIVARCRPSSPGRLLHRRHHGEWAAPSQPWLDQFNKFAGMKLNAKVASLDAVDAIMSGGAQLSTDLRSRLPCRHERCVRITCRTGYEVGDDNTCVRIEPKKPREKTAVAAKPQTAPSQRSNARPVVDCKPNGTGTTSAVMDPRPRCIDLNWPRPSDAVMRPRDMASRLREAAKRLRSNAPSMNQVDRSSQRTLIERQSNCRTAARPAGVVASGSVSEEHGLGHVLHRFDVFARPLVRACTPTGFGSCRSREPRHEPDQCNAARKRAAVIDHHGHSPPVLGFVTVTRDPKGSVRCAAVSAAGIRDV